MKIRGPLDRAEIADFLDGREIPARLACRTPAGHLWMLSLWYRYRSEADGWILECSTSANATIVDYLESNPEVAFEISTNRPPYRGVRGRGTASIDPDPEKETLRELLEAYLGGTESGLAESLLSEDREEVRITVAPAVVYGWDFSERMSK